MLIIGDTGKGRALRSIGAKNSSAKRCLLVLASVFMMLLATLPASSQTDPFPRCSTGCTSNNFEVHDFYLSPTGPCIDGFASATLYADVVPNANTINCLYIAADIHQEGEDTLTEIFYIPLINKDTSSPGGITRIEVGDLYWKCGSNVYIDNLYLIWGRCPTGAYSYCEYGPDYSGCCGIYPSSNWAQCWGGYPGFDVIIPGIKIIKQVDTAILECSCVDTVFEFDVTDWEGDISIICEGDVALSPLDPAKAYSVTEREEPGWILTDVYCTSSIDGREPDCVEIPGGVSVTLVDQEEVTVTFVNAKCPTVDAGDDHIVCAVDPVYLEGTATCYSQVVGWSILSCEPECDVPGCCGTLEVDENDPTNLKKAKYIPPLNGATQCTLRFEVRGACSQETVYDDTIVYIVSDPIPVITPN